MGRSSNKSRSRPSGARSAGILVLGMHRSGTSAMAGVLDRLGVDLGDHLVGPQEGVNDQGFWEHVDVLRLDQRLLEWHQRDWHDVRGLPQSAFSGDVAAGAVSEAAGILRRDFGERRLWAIKDPRLCLTAPIWLRAMAAEHMEPRFLLMVRDPDEVAASLAKRDSITRGHAWLLWGEYLRQAVRHSAGGPRLVVDYANLMEDWKGEQARIAHAFDLEWPSPPDTSGPEIDRFLDRSLHRHRGGGTSEEEVDDRLRSAVAAVHAEVRALGRDRGDWNRLERALEEFAGMARALAPHLHEVLEHAYMHGDRATAAERLVLAGLNGSADLVRQLHRAVTEEHPSLAIIRDETRLDRESAALREADLRAGLDSLRGHASALEQRRLELEVSAATLRGELETYKAELAGREGKLSALSVIVQEKEQRLRDAQARIDGLEGGLAAAREREVAGLERSRVLEQAIAAAEARTSSLEQDRLALERAVAEREASLRDTQARASSLEEARLALERAVAEGEASLRDTQARASALEEGHLALERMVAEREASLTEAQGHASALETALHAARRDVQRLERRLADLDGLLSMRVAEVARIVESHSWRLTAPLRWLRGVMASLGRGRRPLTYRQVLAAPGAPGALPSPAPPPPVPDPSVAPDTPVPIPAYPARYLDDLFASERGEVSPEHRPASIAPAPPRNSLRAKAIAFYLPQFHPFPENDAWWGRGFTEWANAARAVPQFVGHEQPRLPADLGFYDLRLPEVIREQVKLARRHGIHGFCFHYYWFGGKRLLEKPLDLFLRQADLDFPFCLCWANENWTRRWDGRDQEILISQEHSADNDLAFIRDLLPYLRDPRYIRVDGRPLVIVYRPGILPDCRSTLQRWRDYCRNEGIGELFLAMVQFDIEDPREFGFDAAMEFPPHKLARDLPPINDSLDIVNPDYRGHVVHYQSIVDAATDWPEPDYPMVRAVFPGWDNEARRPGAGYTFAHATPARYAQWLESAVTYANAHPVGGEALVMINAWNEWAEGAYLEPDKRYGHAFLQATRDVLAGGTRGAGDRRRIVLVSHDAHPHGAQYLALHLARELDRSFGLAVDLVLLGDGSLREDFAKYATVHDASGHDEAQLDALARSLRDRGAMAALANTTVSGAFVASLKQAGLRVVSLVHELPGLIQRHGLRDHADSLARNADHVVFAAPQVRDAFVSLTGLGGDRTSIRPQGLFTRSRYLGNGDRSGARSALRRHLGIDDSAQVVLAVGYGDHRKGLDLFGEVAAILAQGDPCLHFVWVGHFDDALMSAVRQRLHASGVSSRFHAPGMDFDTDDYYAGADAYALTSREDPFPSVVLEALSVGLPVVAFAGAGGADQLLCRGCGVLVEPPTAAAFARALRSLLDDPEALAGKGEQGRRIVASEYGFRRYAFDLLALAGEAPPRVSVVVPNYNYGPLLRARLESIAVQDLPPYEVIVLDDGSTDDSLEILARLHEELDLEFSVVPAGENSGSAFRQWLKGAEMARGEFLWIAEADDLADPGFLSALLPQFADDESVLMAYSQSRAIDSEGRIVMPDYRSYTDVGDPQRWNSPFKATGAEEANAGLAVKNTIPNVSAAVFRREALASVLREHIDAIAGNRVAGDWVTYLRLLHQGRIAFVPDVLNSHRRHGSSITGALDRERHLAEVLAVQQLARDTYPVDEATLALASAYASALREQFGLAPAGADAAGAV